MTALATLPAEPVVFWFNVGMSAATMARKVGTPAVPSGAARKKLAVLLAYGFCVSPYPEARLMVTEPVDALAVTGEVPANDVTPVLLMVSVPEPVVVLIPVPVPRDATE